MTAAECHEVAKRERRIEQLEAELDRKANVISQMADDLAEVRSAGRAIVNQCEPIDSWRHEDNSTCLHRLRAGDIRSLRAAVQ